eukprot:78376-Chlamydomonas_euryale.AAC.8
MDTALVCTAHHSAHGAYMFRVHVSLSAHHCRRERRPVLHGRVLEGSRGAQRHGGPVKVLAPMPKQTRSSKRGNAVNAEQATGSPRSQQTTGSADKARMKPPGFNGTTLRLFPLPTAPTP